MTAYYESFFPDDESITKVIVIHMNITLNATLNRLRKRLRPTFNQRLGPLWETVLSLEFINVANTAFNLELETISQTAVSGGVHTDTSHFDHMAPGKVLDMETDDLG